MTSSRQLRIATVSAQVWMVTLNSFILSMSITMAIIATLLATNSRVGLQLTFGAFPIEKYSMQFLQDKNHNVMSRILPLDIPNDLRTISEMHPGVFRVIAGFLVLFFVFFICLSALGCYATATKSVLMTETFTISCGYLLLSYFGLHIVFLVCGSSLEEFLKAEARRFISNDYSAMLDDAPMNGNLIDFVQARFECCGVANSSDFGQTVFPTSCCRLRRYGLRNGLEAPVFVRSFETCPERPSVENSNMATGCFPILWTWGTQILNALFSCVAFILWILFILGLLSASLLRQEMHERLQLKELVKVDHI